MIRIEIFQMGALMLLLPSYDDSGKIAVPPFESRDIASKKLNVPPLKERREDIPLLAQHFLKKFADKNRKAIKGFVPLAMDMLVKYDWPGNVRELENAIERAVILATGEHIAEMQLPLNITEQYGDLKIRPTRETQILDGTHSLEDIEKEAILAALTASNGNKAEAARRLGITRRTFYNKLKSFELDSE